MGLLVQTSIPAAELAQQLTYVVQNQTSRFMATYETALFGLTPPSLMSFGVLYARNCSVCPKSGRQRHP